MRAYVFDGTIGHAHVHMPEICAHASHFGQRLDPLLDAQLCSSPRRELITVAAASCEHVRNRPEALAAARLRLVPHAALLQKRRIRMRSQVKYIERAQCAHKHIQVLDVDGWEIELNQQNKPFPPATVKLLDSELAPIQL